MDQDGKRRAADFAQKRLGQLGWSTAYLATRAGVSEDTVRDFLRADRWPWEAKRNLMEEAMGMPRGTLERVARDSAVTDVVDGDPVEVAIQESELTRANQHKLIGMYLEMLDEQQRGVRGA